MSVIYIIKSVGDTLNLDAQYFVQELQKKWANAEVHFITGSNSHDDLQWQVPEYDSILGDFDPETIGFQVNGLPAIVAVAHWFRSIVPAKHRLILFNSALDFEPIEVTADLTEDQLISGFEIPFDGSKFE